MAKFMVQAQQAFVSGHHRDQCLHSCQHERPQYTATPQRAEPTCSSKLTFVANLHESSQTHQLTDCTGRKRQEQIEGFEQQIEQLNQEIIWLRSFTDMVQAKQPLPICDTNHLSAPSTGLAWPTFCKVPFQARNQASYGMHSLEPSFSWF